MINITLPAITPTIVIMLILNCNNIVNAGFDQIFMLYSALVYDVADIIDTYVYRIGIQKQTTPSLPQRACSNPSSLSS